MHMEKLILFCKSYRNDLPRVVNLLNSIQKHNRDGIPTYISVPTSDFDLFASVIDTSNVHLITDESITDQLTSEAICGLPPGYINQEIVKLEFWKTSLCKNYFCIDSDSYFIRDFGYHDFMYDDVTPYSVLIEDKELCIDPDYRSYWTPRHKRLMDITKVMDYKSNILLTCHNSTTFNSKVLESFNREFLSPKGFALVDILKIAPYEFSWYNFWLQKEKPIMVIPVEPLFKMFHYKKQYNEAREKGITERDIARAYIGIVMNSNWNPGAVNCRYIDPSKGLLHRLAHKRFGVKKRVVAALKNLLPKKDI